MEAMCNELLSMERLPNDIARAVSYRLYDVVMGKNDIVEKRHQLLKLVKDAMMHPSVSTLPDKERLEATLINTDILFRFLRPHLIYNKAFFKFAATAKPEVGFDTEQRLKLIETITEHYAAGRNSCLIPKLENKLFGAIRDNRRKMCEYNGITDDYILDLLKRGSGLLYGNLYPMIVLTGGWPRLKAAIEETEAPEELLIKHTNRIFCMQSPDMYAEIFPIAYQIRIALTSSKVKRWSEFLSPKHDTTFEVIYSKLSADVSVMAKLVLQENRVLEKGGMERVVVPAKMQGKWLKDICTKEISKLLNYVLFTPNPATLEEKANWIRSEDFFKACIMQTRKKMRWIAVSLKGNTQQLKANRYDRKRK